MNIRIAVRGYSHLPSTNPYTKCFLNALQNSGFKILEELELEDQYLVDNSKKIDAIHLQWIEHHWPRRGVFVLKRLRSIFGVWRYLKTAKKTGIKVIVTVHNVEPHESFDWVDKIGFKTVARNSDLLICHSQEAANVVKNRDNATSEVVVMHHGNYDNSYPKPRMSSIVREELGFDPSIPVVTCIGLLREYKGVEIAATAAQQLQGEAQLLIAGAQDDEYCLKNLQSILSVTPSARLISRRLTDQEFADYVSASDLILLPYRKITGSGALLAAWSFGRSVVVSDLPFFREMLSTAGGGGTIFRTGDVADLVEKIRIELSTPPEERQHMAFNAGKQFSWDRCVEPVVKSIKKWSTPRSQF